MDTIIVATDFSDASKNAAEYAANMNQQIAGQLHLFHAFNIPFSYTDNPLPIVSIEELTAIANEQLETECKRLQALFPNISIAYSSSPGETIDCLTEVVEQMNPLLVVMGTSGSSGNSLLWGSVAVQALRQLPSAVLSIPLTAKWKKIERICCAADYKNKDVDFPFYAIKKWVKLTAASLKIVHVNQSDVEEKPDAIFIESLNEIKPEYNTVKHVNIGEAVAEFVRFNQADWLMVIPKKYGFFENLFHKSRTEMLANANYIPILALH